MTELNPAVARVTERIVARSRESRIRYLDLIAREGEQFADRGFLSCSNLAHGFAAAGEDKASIATQRGPNIGIVTAYNDMLSAHQPYGRYPEHIKLFAREVGVTAQVAGGTPASPRRPGRSAAQAGPPGLRPRPLSARSRPPPPPRASLPRPARRRCCRA